MPHNCILNDKRIKEVFKEYVSENAKEINAKKVKITLDKEADYMFVVNWKRKEILTDQLDAIEEHY